MTSCSSTRRRRAASVRSRRGRQGDCPPETASAGPFCHRKDTGKPPTVRQLASWNKSTSSTQLKTPWWPRSSPTRLRHRQRWRSPRLRAGRWLERAAAHRRLAPGGIRCGDPLKGSGTMGERNWTMHFVKLPAQAGHQLPTRLRAAQRLGSGPLPSRFAPYGRPRTRGLRCTATWRSRGTTRCPTCSPARPGGRLRAHGGPLLRPGPGRRSARRRVHESPQPLLSVCPWAKHQSTLSPFTHCPSR